MKADEPEVDNEMNRESADGIPLASLKLKLSEDHELGPLPPDLRERRQEELIYSQKIFNNILKLKKLLLKVFNEQSWLCINSGTKFKFKNKSNSDQVVVVEKIKNEIRFSGNAIAKIIEVSNRYEAEIGVDINYVIEALTLNDAVDLVKQLYKNKADITRITEFDLKSKTPHDLKSIIAETRNATARNANTRKS